MNRIFSFKMTEGTKSVIFGSHSIIHSILVYIAWIKLYRQIPSFEETVCILVHDLGYIGMNHLTNKSNKGHAKLGAKIADYLFDYDLYAAPWLRTHEWRDFVLGHSLSECKESGIKPSKLERPDEYSFVIAPMWWLKWNHMIENFQIPAEVWKEEVTKNFYSSERVSGTELLNKLKEKK